MIFIATWQEIKNNYTWRQLNQFKYAEILNSLIDELGKIEAGHISKELDKELERLETISQSYVGQYNLIIDNHQSSESISKTNWIKKIDRCAKLVSIANDLVSIAFQLTNPDLPSNLTSFLKSVFEFINKLFSENI